jgi:hypothetical protein
MTKEKMNRWGVEAEGFNSTEEMLQTVETFLTLASIRPSGGAAD